MTMPELLAAICTAQEAARKAGATDAEVQELRRSMIAEHRTETTVEEYQNKWTPGIPPVPEPKRKPINPGRTYDRKGDLF